MLELPASVQQTSSLSTLLDIIDKVTKILAVIVGAGWVYLNYLRGRTFKHRLEPAISGKTIRSKGILLLSGLAQIKNVGLSRVLIQQAGTAVEVLSYTLNGEDNKRTLALQDVGVLTVFKKHGWVEPGETVEETFMLPVPEGGHTVAFRIGVRIVSQGIEWNADAIVEIAPSDSLDRVSPFFQASQKVVQNAESAQRTREIERKKGLSETV